MIMTVYISMFFFVIRLKVIKMVGGDCQKSTPVVLKKISYSF